MAANAHAKMPLWLLLAFFPAVLSSAAKSQPEPWIRGSWLMKHWVTSLFTTSSNIGQVPPQLLVMSKENNFLHLPHRVQANLADILTKTPGLKLRWMGENSCRHFLQAHYDMELVTIFRKEESQVGRSDICRTAVLLKEGGFYADLDVQLKAPLGHLVDPETTFMSVYSERSHTTPNALMAAKPGSPVLAATLMEMRKWYRFSEMQHAVPADKTLDSRMGPLTLLRGIRHAVREQCPETTVGAHMAAEFSCGEEVLRFHRERSLNCEGNVKGCGEGRASSLLEDHRIGLFAVSDKVHSLVGWPRGAWCVSNSCGEEMTQAVGKQWHAGTAAFWPLLLGMGTFAIVLPNMVFGFQDMFLLGRDVVKGSKFQKGYTGEPSW